MTVETLKPGAIAADAVANARTVAVSTAPGLVLFCAAMGAQAYFNELANHGGNLLLLWLVVSQLTLFVGCFWSADMYRKLLPEAGTRRVIGDAWRLFLANVAVYALFFIICFLLTLFFSIFAGILIGTSGYDPSQNVDPTEAVWQSIDALAGTGGAAVLYILLLIAAAGLVWLGLRLFLFGAATVAAGQITIFSSWPWTKRHVARIALLWLALQAVPWLVLTLIASGVLHLAGINTVYSLVAGAQSAAPELPVWYICAMTAIATFVTAPFYWLGHGLAVALYQRLSPIRVDAETTFG